MDAKTYYSHLNSASQQVFTKSLSEAKFLGAVQDYSISLQEWLGVLKSEAETQLLKHAIEEVEISCLSVLLGVYRQAFASLRLSLEMLFGSIYFSAHKLEYVEWTKGSRDLNWGHINNKDNGVLSYRFMLAFCPEMCEDAGTYFTRASELYRSLSEFVHGNFHTWNTSTGSLNYNQELLNKYNEFVKEVKNVAHFILFTRFIHELNKADINKIDANIKEELFYLSKVQAIMAGSTEAI